MTWQSALDYVKTLNTGGHTDWRLPNVNELRSLVDYSQIGPCLPQGHPFTNVQSSGYWSSTTRAEHTVDAWIVNMHGGSVEYGGKSDSGYSYAWPVRAGLGGNSSTTTTTITPETTTTTTIPGGTTTTTTYKPALCVAALIYGENSEQTELLKKYRDNVLSKTTEGQKTIKTYYKLSPTVTKLLEQWPLLKKRAKAFIDSLLPNIRKRVEEDRGKIEGQGR